MTRTLKLLKTDDEYPGLMARQDVIALMDIALRLRKAQPTIAKQLYALARRVRATIPTSAWTDEALAFPKSDPHIALDPVE